MATTTAAAATTSSSTTPVSPVAVSSGATELDERIVAKAALDAAEEQLQSLCASHAGTFVSVERRGKSLEGTLKDLQRSIDEMEGKVSQVQKSLEQDEQEDHHSLVALSEKHRVRRRTLLQHSSLLELLELPNLMDACVRSNIYEDALSIAAFANILERRHNNNEHNNIVVARVIFQVRSRQADLRRHLLNRLKSNVTMPQCLEVVTALRRLNSIDLECQPEADMESLYKTMELKLQIDFLEARDAWLDSNPHNAVTAAVSTTTTTTTQRLSTTGSTSEQLLDMIERYRTRLFEVATQFEAIFRNQSDLRANNNNTTTATTTTSSVSLLSMWTSRRIHSFLNMLASRIGRMEDTGALRDALEACVFFSTSLGRFGGDFTAHLSFLFEPRILELVVDRSWKEGLHHLEETLVVCREAGVASPLVSSSHTTTTTELLSDGGPMEPPRILMETPPLARFVNAILTGLNDLRRSLLPGIFYRLRMALHELLDEATQILKTNERMVHAPVASRGGPTTSTSDIAALRQAAVKMKQVWETIVDPYVRGSLEMALGSTEAGTVFYQQLLDNLKPKEEIEEVGEEGNDGDDDNNEEEPKVAEEEPKVAEEEPKVAEEEPEIPAN